MTSNLNQKSRHKRPQKAANKEVKTRFYIEGPSVIADQIKLNPEQVVKVYHREPLSADLQSAIKKSAISIERVEDSRIEFEGYQPRSPIFAALEIRLFPVNEFFDKMRKASKAIIVVCDHINDPHNLGAIVRTCAFLGVDHVVIPEKRQVPITQVVVNVAQGGLTRTRVTCVKNISQFLKKLKKEGFWVFCADMDGESVSAYKHEFDKIALVVGAEGKGVSPIVKKESDVILRIAGADQTIDSLNVSVATGILLHHLVNC